MGVGAKFRSGKAARISPLLGSLGWEHEVHDPGPGQSCAPGHLLDAVRAIVLIVHVACHVLQIMPVCALAPRILSSREWLLLWVPRDLEWQ